MPSTCHCSTRSFRSVLPSLLILVVLLATFFVVGCERQIAPPLVEVTELAPREVEPGDRLEVRGTGFPQGRNGRVTLNGTVYRSGEPAIRGVSIDADGTVATPDRLEVVVREAFAERFCGRGDRAAHATFQGEVEIAFASSTPGAPPLVGRLHGATLDILPASARASVLEARVAEGGRVLAFLGIVPGMVTPRGLPIEKVNSGSLAERAGIQVGDVIVSVDGVHVLSFGDAVPASARSVELTIRHGDSGGEETKTLPMLEYSAERVPTEYAPALIIVGLAFAMLVLLVLPGPPSLAVLEMRIASRVRRTTIRGLLAGLFGRGRHAAISSIVTAIIAAFALTPYVIGREIDGVALLAGAALMLVWSCVARERGLVASLRTLAQTSTAVVAMVMAVALTIAQIGAIELAEIVRSQGGAPWQFAAARHPSCAILAIIYAVAVIGILRTRTAAASSSSSSSSSSATTERRLSPPTRSALLERVGVLLAAALGVIAFLGGWQLPGVDARNAEQLRGMLFASAGIFVLKTWIVTAVFLGASHVASSCPPRDLVRLFVRRLLPAFVVAAALVIGSRRLVPGTAIETALGATLVALTTLFVIRLATRVRTALGRPEPHASPFL